MAAHETSSSDHPTAITFAPFRLDLRSGRLFRGEEIIALRPKTWAVLLHLAQRPGALVTNDALLDAVWPGVAVTPDVVSKSIGELRTVLGEDRRRPRFIETVPRRGFRFIAEIDVPGSRSGFAETQPETRDGGPGTNFFVGREEELQHLETRLAKAHTGERQVVFITGSAGIGKTALVDAFLDAPIVRQTPQPVRIARAACIEQHGLPEPYMPLLNALERLSRRLNPGHLRDLLRQIAPTWLVQMPWMLEQSDVATLRESLQAVQSIRMLRELAVLLETLTRDVTLVLVLEDLHWSDPSTVDLLSVLGKRRDPARLLLIGTYRPAEVAVSEHPLGSVVRTLQVHRHCTQRPLSDLSEAGVCAYLERRFPGGDFSAALASRIYAHTEGDPLFMVAIVDHLLSRGWILDTAPGWALAARLEAVDWSIPDDARLMIEAQLDGLNAAERSLLEVASVARTDAVTAILAAAFDGDVAETERRCETLARTQRFLRVAGSDDGHGFPVQRYEFVHELHRQVVYERMPEGQRARLHQCIGEALEATYGTRTDEIASRLAVHFELSRDRTRAIHYLAAAGTQARARYANREAIGYFASALALVRSRGAHASQQQELDLRMALGRALSDVDGFAAESVRENCARAAELAAIIGNTAQRFEILYALWYLHAIRAERNEAIAIAAELDDCARRSGDAEQGVLADSALMRTALYDGRLVDVRRGMDSLRARQPHRARRVTVDYGVDPIIAATLHYAMALWFLGDPHGAQAHAATGLAAARASGNPVFVCAAQAHGALVELLCRESHRGGELAEHAESLSAEHGFAYWGMVAAALHAWARIQSGHTTSECSAIERTLQMMRDAHGHFFSAFLWAFLAEGRWRAGDFAGGLAAADEGLHLTETTLDRAYAPELWRLKGELLWASSGAGTRRAHPTKRIAKTRAAGSQGQQAERCLLRALELARAAEAKSLELRAATSLARAWQTQGLAAEARELLAPVCAWFGTSTSADLIEARVLLGAVATARPSR